MDILGPKINGLRLSVISSAILAWQKKKKSAWKIAGSVFALALLVSLPFVLGPSNFSRADGEINVYYSVGQNTDDHKTGTPTIDISGGVATFSEAQTATNFGVGDKISYGFADATTTIYISAKQSTTVWNVITATGGQPTATTTAAVLKISHAFASLASALPSGAGGAKGASYLNTTDLVAGNYVLNIPCYYDSGPDTGTVAVNGWTTGPNNYIKIYTPNNTATEANQSQRHAGKWDDAKYKLDVSVVGGGVGIRIQGAYYIWIDGLQIKNAAPNDSSTAQTSILSWGETSAVRQYKISNNILRGVNDLGQSSYHHGAISLYSSFLDGSKIYIWNNIMYDFNVGGSWVGAIESNDAQNRLYIYNNTVYNCSLGIISYNGGTFIAKNNISYNNTDNYYGTFAASSTNNLSGPSQTDAPGDNPQNAKRVSFVSTSTYDFHLLSGDVNAKNNGANLSSDPVWSFSNDIDGQTRTGSWDIGADEYTDITPPIISVIATSTLANTATITWTTNENATSSIKYGLTSAYGSASSSNIYASTTHSITLRGLNSNTLYHYRVESTDASGNRATSTDYAFRTDRGPAANIYYSVGQNLNDHKTGNPTLTISNGVGTFSVSQTATNMGIGDRIGYGTGVIAYISGKISSSQWTLITATGTIPADITDASVEYIMHAFDSLNSALPDAVGGAKDADHLNTSDLVAGNYILNIPCYYDSGSDTSANVSGWTTGSGNYIRIYTPTSTIAEANSNQRASGKWDENKYHLEPPVDVSGIFINSSYVKIDGLQVYIAPAADTDYAYGFWIQSGGENDIRNSILRGPNANSTTYKGGLRVTSNDVKNNYISNTIIYDFSDSGYGYGIALANSFGSIYAYNDTIYNCGQGFWTADGTDDRFFVKNSITQGVGNGYVGIAGAGSDYNISDLAGDAPGANSKNLTTVSFVDQSGHDFHLAAGDTAAKDSGINLSADPNLFFSTDIDGQARTGSWDIGADEYSLSGIASAVNVYYSVGQNTNDHKTGTPTLLISSDGIGTFSVEQTAVNMGVGDKVTYDGSSVAYISAKISATQWRLITATGAIPATVSGAVVNSISHAFDSLSAALPSGAGGAKGADYLNTTDLVAGNYVLNIPCYYDSGPDTTAVEVNGWTTGASNYVKVYTPFNTASEVNLSQRHSGKWGANKYRLEPSGTVSTLTVSQSYTRVEGLQIKTTSANTASLSAIRLYKSGDNPEGVYVANNILTEGNMVDSGTWRIGVEDNLRPYASHPNSIFNNIAYNFTGFGFRTVNGAVATSGRAYLFNNTSFNNLHYGFALPENTAPDLRVVVKNNLSYDNGSDYCGNTYHASSTNNAFSSSGSGIGSASLNLSTACGGSLCASSTIFIDPANSDFHLKAGSPVIGLGANLSADLNLAFTTDIDGQTRTGAWDIGADEYVSTGFVSAQKGSGYLNGPGSISAGALNVTAGNALLVGCGGGDAAGGVTVSDTAGNTFTLATTTESSDFHTASRIFYATNVIGDANDIVSCNFTSTGDSSVIVFQFSGIAGSSALDATAVGAEGGQSIVTSTAFNTATSSEVAFSCSTARGSTAGVFTAGAGYTIPANGAASGPDEKSYACQYQIFSSKQTNSTASISVDFSPSIIVLTLGTFKEGSVSADTTPPTPGSSGTITTSDVSSNSLTLNWTKATDDTWAQGALQYRAYRSISNNIDSVTNIEANGTPVNSYTADIDTLGVSSLNPSTTYYFNVIVKDGAGNKTAYITKSEATATSTVAKNIFYSVGQNTDDHKTGSPTLTIVDGVGTFSEAQTATNMGVGDKVTYNISSIAYISGKISNTQWTLITVTGAAPANIIGSTVVSVAHAFASLSSALPSGAGGAKGANYLNSADLVAGNYVLNIPCYYDSGPDTTAVAVEGWTTSENNYIKIYTPNNTATEANQSQRHAGKWDNNKYNLSVTTAGDVYVIHSGSDFVKVDGLQVKVVSTGNNQVVGIGSADTTYGTGGLWASNNIVQGVLSGNSYSDGICRHDWTEASVNYKFYAWNNIIYGFLYDSGNVNQGGIYCDVGNCYAYNNTVYDSNIGVGLHSSTGFNVAKNNLAYNNANNYHSFEVFAASSTNNLSGPSQTDAPGDNPRNAATVSFSNASLNDFHLAAGDAGAIGYGANLSADPALAFNTDIEGQARGSSWDIGADQYAYQVILGYNMATIIWPTAIATSSKLDYGTTANYNLSSSSAASVTTHSLTIKGLTPKTVYHFLMHGTSFGDQTFTSLDVVAPTITAFSLPASIYLLTVPITFTATDDTGVTGYFVSESSSTPSLVDNNWSASAPASFTFSAFGVKKLYAWARDIDGNLSARASSTVTITFVTPTQVYYSVGQNTADHKTGTPTVTISGGVATFSEAQTASNMGVGDKISYGYAAATTTVYISTKQSNTVWNVITRTGGEPTATTTAAVLKISHAFSSLASALPSGAGGAKGANYLNTTDLVAGNYALNIPCYYDSGPDTTAVTVDGWTTGENNYVKIYTPNNTATEANQSQRHAGVWDALKYNLDVSSINYGVGIHIKQAYYIWIDGLQIRIGDQGSPGANTALLSWGETNAVRQYKISNNIMRGVNDLGQTSYHHGAISLYNSFLLGSKMYIWNNIMYDFNVQGDWVGAIESNDDENRLYIYNNTVYNCNLGIISYNGGTFIAKNNISYNNTDNYYGSFAASSTNNLSGPTQIDAPGSNPRNAAVVSFVATSSADFHLVAGDTGARNYGADLSADSKIAFATDIDGQTRIGSWDIGADEYADITAPVISNIATSTTVNTATITWTTNENATSSVKYGLTSAYGSASSSNIYASTTHSITLRGLNSNTLYHFRVESTDASGNRATTTDHTFTTANPINIFYSVGQNTNDHKTGSPTVTISGGVATFSEAQTASNMGVGDKISYGYAVATTTVYISAKQSNTVWNVITRTGGEPIATTTAAVLKISHAFASLASALPSGAGGAKGANYLNTTNLVTGNYVLNIPCYYDSGPDTAAVVVSGWTTGVSNYIKVYTPDNPATEANSSQRHNGKWNASAYNIVLSNTSGILVSVPNILIDGLQVYITSTNSAPQKAIYLASGGVTDSYISNNIVRGAGASADPYHSGIAVHGATGGVVRIWNNIVYNFLGGTDYGIELCATNFIYYIYDNTLYNNNVGTWNQSSTLAKNNISYNNGTNYQGSYLASSTNNLSGPSQTSAPGSNPRNAAIVSFVATSSADFHLAAGDTNAKNYGADLSADPNLAFTTDIDGQTRTGSWDIGADEYYDTTAPIISLIASSTGINSALITWTTDKNATSSVYYGTSTSYGYASSSNALASSTHSIILRNLTGTTTYHFQVASTDISGNRSSSTDYVFTTRAGGIPDDFNRMNNSEIENGWEQPSGAVDIWDIYNNKLRALTNNDDYNEQYIYRPLTEIATNTEVSVDFNASSLCGYPQILLRTTDFDLAPTGYLFYVSNSCSSAQGTGVIRLLNDSWEQEWYAATTAAANHNYRMIASAITNGSQVDLTLRILDLENSNNEIFNETWSDTAAGRITNAGRQGLSGYSSQTILFDNFQVSSFDTDAAAPEISSIATSTTANSATITWTTDELATSSVYYGTSTAYGLASSSDIFASTTHSITLRGLTSDTLYHFQIGSTDQYGNRATSTDYTFHTLDASAPIIDSFVIPSISNSLTINIIDFTAHDNTVVTGYLVNESSSIPSLADPAWETSATTTYTFVVAGTRTLYAWARDDEGNISASSTDTVWVDNTRPLVGDFIIQPLANSTLISINSFTAEDDKTWSEVRPAGDVNAGWSVLSISGDGSDVLAGTNNGRLYLSHTSGESWSEVRPAGDVNAFWRLSAMSPDGSVIIAGVSNGRLYRSTNYGASWSETRPAGDNNRYWSSASVSSDGSRIVVSAYSGRLYRSTNYGASWSELRPDGNANYAWNFISMSGDGSVLVASQQNVTSKSYRSINYGDNWSTISNSGYWNSAGISYNGSVIAVTTSGDLMTSTDFGVNWVGQPLVQATWRTVVSSDGLKIVAASDDSGFFVSANAGLSWSEIYPSGGGIKNWGKVAISSDGQAIITSEVNGRLYYGGEHASNTVTGYLVSETSAVPSLSDSRWESSATSSYIFSSEGSKVLYGFAKDLAGNISSSSLDYCLVDVSSPTISSFSLPAISASTTISITNLIAVDNGRNYQWSEIKPLGSSVSGYTTSISDDGRVMLVSDSYPIIAGQFYLSTDFGSSWLQPPLPDTDWMGSSMSADGTKIIISGYLSTTTGATWAELPFFVETSAMSNDGSVMLGAGGYGTRLYLSTTTGDFWAETRPKGDVDDYWYSPAMSDDGSVIAVVSYEDRFYLSTSTGDTWSEIRPVGDVDVSWGSLAMSSNGSVIIAGLALDKLYISTTTGSSWAKLSLPANSGVLDNLSMSADGSEIFVVANDALYYSADFGETWSKINPNGLEDILNDGYFNLSSSADGSRLIVGGGYRSYFGQDNLYYLLSESSSTPSINDSAWELGATSTYTFATAGNKTLYVWAMDNTDNISLVASDTILIDIAASQISAVATSTTPYTATITWTTDENATSTINYGLTTAYDSASSSDIFASTTHSITLHNLTATTSYNFQITVRDAAGNVSTSSNYTFKTAEAGPVANVYYSVGQNTADHKTGTPTLTIVDGVGTFSVAQTATNMGVGDKVTYNTNVVAYISGKVSSTTWNLITATGGTPVNITDSAVVSITHAFNSLSAALPSGAGGAKGADYLNTTDLIAENYVLNIPCYYDSGADAGGVAVSGWTTGENNYLKIYTPNNTATEVNQTQRHNGVWDDNKFRIVNAGNGILSSINYIRIEGIQGEDAGPAGYDDAPININGVTGSSTVYISNNILRQTNKQEEGDWHNGITIYSGVSQVDAYIFNNIIYGFSGVSGQAGIVFLGHEGYIYNNTLYDNGYGFYVRDDYSTGVKAYLKNNITQKSADGYSIGSGAVFDSSSNNNISDISGDAPNNGFGGGYAIVSFISTSTKDFLLSPSDTAAKNQGADLSTDPFLAFTTDINGQTRSGSWDIGADEHASSSSDITPPVISNIATSTLANSATITWTTNENATSSIKYGLASAYGSASSSNIYASSTHSITLRNLAANSTYHFQIGSTDASGNRATSSDLIFRTGTSSINIYYSVGQNTNDHKTGTPTLTIVDGVGTFSEAQTATNMGVGDKVTYNISSIAYISGKISNTQWTLITATGATPANVLGSTVVSITHVFSSLEGAVSNAWSAGYLNTSDLVTGNYILNIPCYYDTGADTAAVVVSGWTTGVDNYVKIYTPNNTATEVNQSQRHAGKWDMNKYRLMVDDNVSLYLQTVNVKIDGLQIHNVYQNGNTNAVQFAAVANGNSELSNSILRGPTRLNSSSWVEGIQIDDAGTVKIWNNIIYDFGWGIDEDYSATAYIYNNTFYDCWNSGIYGDSGTLIIKNNLSYNFSGYDDDYNNPGFFSVAEYNLSHDASSPNSALRNKTVLFADAANQDFRLAIGDTSAIDAGEDLSADSVISFNTDISGQTRVGAWDIGADEASFQVIRGTTTATILWLTGEATTSRVNYGTTAGYGLASSSSGLVTSHSITLKGLESGTLYHFEIASTTFGDQTFKTFDLTSPVITSFTLPATYSYLTVPISSFTATDNDSVDAYFVSESSSTPAVDAYGWQHLPQASHTFLSEGLQTLYAWVKDVDGNISSGTSSSVTITLIPPTNIYRSVGPGNTNELASSTLADANNLTINVSGTASFSQALADRIGVGDVLVYDSNGDNVLNASDDIVFIHGRNSNTSYTVKNGAGVNTATTTSANDTWAIYRAYTSLLNAVYWDDPITNVSIPVVFDVFPNQNTKDLVTPSYIWNVACYGDAADTSRAEVAGWTTGVNNYVRIFTPYLPSEVGVSQRHNGIWDDSKYRLEPSSNATSLIVDNDFTRIEGLQIKSSSDSSADWVGAITLSQDSGGYVQGAYINNNIIKEGSLTQSSGRRMILFSLRSHSDYYNYIFNNLIYNPYNTSVEGISITSNDGSVGAKLAIFNNTIVHINYGIDDWMPGAVDYRFQLKNNLVFDSLTADYDATIMANGSSTNNAYSLGENPGDNSLNLSAYASSTIFADPENEDFRLKAGSPVIGMGADLSADADLAFSTDIQSQTRTGSWDIGADEYASSSSDITPPVISNIATSTLANSATITWITDELATSSVYYGTSTAYGLASSSDVFASTTHSITLRGLTSNTLYHFRVESTDASGNRATTTDHTFTTANPINIFYSVGQNTDDHKTGTPTITISNGVAVFSEAQTAVNMGVGDKISYGFANATTTIYISAKQSSTTWSVITRAGGQPTATTTAAVLKISHAFSSLASALPSGAGGAKGANYLNTTDLVTGNYILNIPCYYDSGPDLSSVLVDGWTTGANNYIKVYAPNNTATEVNSSQRHSGKWEADKYRLEITPAGDDTALYFNVPYVKIDGLQIKIISTTGQAVSGLGDEQTSTEGSLWYSNNIIWGVLSGEVFSAGIYRYDATGDSVNFHLYAWNNIIYGFKYGANDWSQSGIFCKAGICQAYNNTIYNSDVGYNNQGSVYTVENNISYDNTDNYYGTFATSSTNNLSGSTQFDAPGSNPQNSKTVNFISASSSNFHLSAGDVNARNNGADLSGDLIWAFSTDIDGQTRTGSWDIGADEFVPLNISGLATSTVSTTAVITWTTDSSATSSVKYGLNSGYGSASSSSVFVTAHSITLRGLDPSTTYHFRVGSADASGVVATSSDYTFTTIAGDDITPPVISAIATSTTANTAAITWTTNENATSSVRYGTSISYGSASSSNVFASTSPSHSITLRNLTTSTVYHFQVGSTDASGNRATSSDHTFTTIAPAYTITASAGANGTVLPAGATIKNYGESQIYTIATSTAGYHVSDILVDGVSVGTSSLIYSFTSLHANHTISATFGIVSVPTTYTIGGTVSGLSGTVVLQNNGGDNLSISANGAFVFAAALNNGAAYSITVLSNPSGQICSVSAGSGTVSGANVSNVSVSCTTNQSGGNGGNGGGGGGGGSLPPAVDTLPPGAVTNFSATSSDRKIDLSWTNPRDVDLAGVKIYRKIGAAITAQGDPAAIVVYQGKNQTLIDGNLQNGQLYYYTIFAYDNSSNYSQSRTLSAQPGSDATSSAVVAPVAPPVVENPNPASGTSGNSGGAVTNLIGASSAVVEQVTLDEAAYLLANAHFVDFTPVEKSIYLRVVALQSKSQPLSDRARVVIAYFIKVGTPSTRILGAGERGGTVASFQSAYGYLPQTLSDWQDTLKIGNGRWPKKQSVAAETAAKVQFQKIYGRVPDMKKPNDNAAVTVIAYGLRPALRNTNSEKAAIKAFRYFYDYSPTAARDWDIVRAIAYSGAKR